MMTRFIVCISCLIAFVLYAGLLPAQNQTDDERSAEQEEQSKETVSLSEVNLPLNRLENWGTRTFLLKTLEPGQRQLKQVGTMTLRVEKTGEGTYTLYDTVDVKSRGEHITANMKLFGCRGSLLRPSKIVSEEDFKEDELKSYRMEIREDKGHVEHQGDSHGSSSGPKNETIDFPFGTLTYQAMYRVVTLLPHQTGKRWSISHRFEAFEIHLKTGGTFQYAGKKSIELHGEQQKLHLIKYKRDERTEIKAWVDENHQLRKLRRKPDMKLVEKNPPGETQKAK